MEPKFESAHVMTRLIPQAAAEALSYETLDSNDIPGMTFDQLEVISVKN